MNHAKADLDAYRQEMIAEDKKNGTALANTLTRQRIVDWGLEAAAENDLDLSKFFATAFVFSDGVDYFGRPGVAVVNFNRADSQMFSVDLTGASHEMGHGHGLTHSRRDGATSEYGDSWDIMSAYSVHEARSDSVPKSVPRPYHTFGPGLNAVSMDIMGWLDETRVWSPPGSGYASVVTLRPLHRRDLPGALAIKVETIYAEFRAKSRWDAAIPNPAVFLHHHGVHPGKRAPVQLSHLDHQGAGWPDVGVRGRRFMGEGLRVERLRRIHQAHRAQDRPGRRGGRRRGALSRGAATALAGPGISFGGVTVGAGGLVWVPGRGFVKVPPRSPLLRVLSKIADFQALQDLHRGGPATEQLSIQILTETRENLDAIITARTDFEVPAPRLRRGRTTGADSAPGLNATTRRARRPRG